MLNLLYFKLFVERKRVKFKAFFILPCLFREDVYNIETSFILPCSSR